MRKSTYVFVTAAAVAGALALGGVARAGDVEIVNPSTGQAAPAAPAPAAVPVQAVQPVQEAPVAAQPQTQRVVHEDVQAPHNVMTTITVSALMGGIAGLLVGGAIYYLADNQNHAGRIGIWAAGGVLVGTGVGIVQVAADESRASAAVSQNWKSDPAPTYRLALFRTTF
jgi:hypothetical protein